MATEFIRRTHRTSAAAKRKRTRICRIEELESREMLAVSVLEFADIDAHYNLGLGTYEQFQSRSGTVLEISEEGLGVDGHWQFNTEGLRAAINHFVTTTPGNTLIVVRTGDTPAANTLNLGGQALAMNSSTLAPASSVTIVSWGDAPLRLIAGSQGGIGDRVFDVNPGATVTLGGLTIQGGNSDGEGGGIRNQGVLKMIKCGINSNVTANRGGAISNTGGGTMTLIGSTVSNNTSTGQWGGGIFNDAGAVMNIQDGTTISNNRTTEWGGGIENWGTLTLTDSNVLDNKTGIDPGTGVSTGTGFGAGISNDMGGVLTVTNSTIAGNEAGLRGGGIWSNTGELTITDSTVSSNKSHGVGGGIYSQFGSLTATNAIVFGNTALGDGGGIYSWSDGALTIARSTISQNTAGNKESNGTITSGSGGGIFINASTTPTITSTVVENNTAYGEGGGVAVYNAAGVSLNDSYVIGNTVDWDNTGTAASGGGIYSEDSEITLLRSWVCGNYSVKDGGGVFLFGGAAVGGKNFTAFNTVIAGNRADRAGGGLHLWGATDLNDIPRAHLEYCTIVGNSAETQDPGGGIGGGIRNQAGYLVLHGTVVAQNIAPDGPAGNVHNLTGSYDQVLSDYYFLEDHMSYFTTPVAHPNNVWGKDSWRTWNLMPNATATAQLVGRGGWAWLAPWGTTDYDIAGNRLDNTSTNDVGAFQYNSAAFAPKIVENVQVIPSATSLLVSWGQVNGASGFTVQWATDRDFTQNVQSQLVGAFQDSINNLVSGQEYFIRVWANGAGGYVGMPFASATVSAQLGQPSTPLTAPATVTAVSKNPTTLTVGWSTVANASGYRIQYATNVDFTGAITVVPDAAGNATNADVSNLTTGIPYYIRVMALGTGDYSDSPYSTQTVSATPTVTPLTAPATVTAESKNPTTLTVGWSTVANASGYRIQYATNVDFTGAITVVPDAAGNATNADVSNLTTGIPYYIRVMALGTGDYSNSPYSTQIVSATPTDVTVTPLTPPVLSVQSKSSTQIVIGWTNNPIANGYEVKWSTINDETLAASGTAIPVGNVWTFTLNSPPIVAGETYYFWVRAIGNGSTTSTSAWTSLSVSATESLPMLATPKIEEMLVLENGEVFVMWNAVANASGYELAYAKSDVLAEADTKLSANNNSWVSLGMLDADETYYFWIRAIGDKVNYDDSGFSQAEAGVPKKAFRLDPPSGVIAASNGNSLTVGWDAVPHATGYIVEWYNGDEWVTSGVTLTPGAARAEITGPQTGEVPVRVTAKGAGNYGDSAVSETTLSHTGNAAAAPNNKIKAKNNNKTNAANSVNLSWDQVDGNFEYNIKNLTTGETITVFGVTSFKWTGLDSNKSYKFEITVKNAAGVAANKVVKVTAKSGKLARGTNPTKLKATGGDNSVALNWVAPASASGLLRYEIRVFPSARNSEAIQVKSVGNNVTSYLVEGLSNKQKFRFEVYAVTSNEDGDVYSAVARASGNTNKAFPAVKKLKASSRTVSPDTPVTLTWDASPVPGATYEIGSLNGRDWQALPSGVTVDDRDLGSTTATVRGMGLGKITLAVRVVIDGLNEFGTAAKVAVNVR